MYLKADGHMYYRGTEACRSRGLFLLFLRPPGIDGATKPIKCAVRKVALRQLGHWMMGTVRLFGKSYTVSGSYGCDGLSMSVPQEVYDRLSVTLPDELYYAWNKGGGWNGAGSEGPAVRKWALENLTALRK